MLQLKGEWPFFRIRWQYDAKEGTNTADGVLGSKSVSLGGRWLPTPAGGGRTVRNGPCFLVTLRSGNWEGRAASRDAATYKSPAKPQAR